MHNLTVRPMTKDDVDWRCLDVTPKGRRTPRDEYYRAFVDFGVVATNEAERKVGGAWHGAHVKRGIVLYNQECILNALFVKPEFVPFMAIDADDPNNVVGFALFERKFPEHSPDKRGYLVAHLVFVRKAYRRLGVARLLFNAAGYKENEKVTVTLLCPFLLNQRFRDKRNIEYNPWQLENP